MELLPSDYTAHPFGSITRNSESETVAANIMRILKRTGNTWRDLTWEECVTERKNDNPTGYFERELGYFHAVQPFTICAKTASAFCKNWPQQPS